MFLCVRFYIIILLGGGLPPLFRDIIRFCGAFILFLRIAYFQMGPTPVTNSQHVFVRVGIHCALLPPTSRDGRALSSLFGGIFCVLCFVVRAYCMQTKKYGLVLWNHGLKFLMFCLSVTVPK